MNFGDEGDDCPFDMMGDQDAQPQQQSQNPFAFTSPPPPPAQFVAPVPNAALAQQQVDEVVEMAPVATTAALLLVPVEEPMAAAFQQATTDGTPKPPVASVQASLSSTTSDAPVTTVLNGQSLSLAEDDRTATAAPASAPRVPTTIAVASTLAVVAANPFGASDSGDFVLSEDASLRADDFPLSSTAEQPDVDVQAPPPAPTSESAVQSPTVSAPSPAPLTHTNVPAATPAPSKIAAATPNQVRAKATPKVLEHNPFESFGGDDNPFATGPGSGAADSGFLSGGADDDGFPDLGAPNNSGIAPQPALFPQELHPGVPHHPQQVVANTIYQPQPSAPSQWAPSLPPMPQFPDPYVHHPVTSVPRHQEHHTVVQSQPLSQSPLLPPLPTLPTFTPGHLAASHATASSFSSHHGIQRSGSSSMHLPPQPYNTPVSMHQRTDSTQSRDLNNSSVGFHPHQRTDSLHAPSNSGFNASASGDQYPQYATPAGAAPPHAIPVPQPHSLQGSPLSSPSLPVTQHHRQVSPPQSASHTPQQLPQHIPLQQPQQRPPSHERQRSEGSIGGAVAQPPPPYPGGNVAAATARSDSAPVHGHASSAHQFHSAMPVAANPMQRRAESQQFFDTSSAEHHLPLQQPQQQQHAYPPQQQKAEPAWSPPGAVEQLHHQQFQQPQHHHFAQAHADVTRVSPDYQQQQQQQHFQAHAQQHPQPQQQWGAPPPQEQSHFVPRQAQLPFQQQVQHEQAAYQPQHHEPVAQHNYGFGTSQTHQFQQEHQYLSPTESHLLARRRGFVGCVAIGGRIIHAGRLSSSGKAQLSLRSLSQVLTSPDASDSGRHYASSMSSLPGCVTVATTKIDVVLKTLQQLTPQVSPILVSVLQAMCTKPMDWAKGGQQELIQVFQSAIAAKKAACVDAVSASPFNPTAQPAWGHAEALDTIQRLLMAGDRQEAVRCAMHYKLHSHALLIAMMCDTKDVYQSVVQAIIHEQLDQRSPLAFAYSTFNELPPPEVTAEEKVSMMAQWAEHVSMMLSNFTRESGESLLQLGDQLVENGQYDCGHVCYLVAQLSPAARPGPQAPPRVTQVADALRTRYLLLGGHYHRSKCRAALIQPHNIFLTEVLEYSRQRENEKFVRAQLIPFRVMMAELYAELGMRQHLESYIQHLGKILPSCQARKDDYATRTVAEVVDALRKRTSATYASPSSAGAQKGSGWWPTTLFGGSATSVDRQGSAAPPRTPLQAPTTGSISRASSANPVPVSRPGGVSPPPQQQQPTHSAPPPIQQQAPPVKGDEPDAAKPAPVVAKKSSWAIGSLFRRGGSQPTPKTEEESKPMIIDTEAPPTFDPVTGRYLFAKSKDEQAVEDQIKAGPPKMLSTPTSGPGMPMGPPQGQFGAPGGPPPPPGQGMGGQPIQRKYVDMFNS